MTGGVVFAGYGITAPEYNYDDYKGIDVHGKIVLIMRHEPQEFDEKSIFEGKVYTQHSQFWSKAANAKMHGARGVVLMNDARGASGRGRRAGEVRRGRRTRRRRHSVRADPVRDCRPLVRDGRQEPATRFRRASTRTCSRARSRFPNALQVDANLDVERVVKTVHNVAGYLPGTTDEYVVIGAHYDHLGLGEQYSHGAVAGGNGPSGRRR